jgi:hypothetical protein
VLDAAASNIRGFLWRDACISSTQLNRPFGNKESLSPQEKPKLQEVFLSKTNSIVTGNNVLDAPGSDTNHFLSRDTYVCSTQLNWPIGTKSPYIHHENPKLHEVFLSKTYSILMG